VPSVNSPRVMRSSATCAQGPRARRIVQLSMSDRDFVDTNILMYAHDSSAGAKHERAKTQHNVVAAS